jgi:hypothetical protein
MAIAISNKHASMGMLIAGYIFAFLGGLIGIAIGASLRMGKVKDASGNKVFAYNEASRKQGLFILVIGIVSLITWKIVAAS